MLDERAIGGAISVMFLVLLDVAHGSKTSLHLFVVCACHESHPRTDRVSHSHNAHLCRLVQKTLATCSLLLRPTTGLDQVCEEHEL